MEDRQEAIKHLSAFLRAVGAPIDDDPEMKTTAERVTHAYADHLLSGYQQHPAEILAEATQSKSEALVVVGALPLMTLCPHHLLPAIGTASLAYLPGGQVVGFGALARLMACFARRLSLQEDLAQDVADAALMVACLPPRAHVHELVIKPTWQEYA